MARPTIVDEIVLAKLEEAFALGCSDTEACLMANISPSTLYYYQEQHPEFTERKKELKETPVLIARTSVVKSLRQNPQLALQYLERKKKAEFAPRTELTGSEGTPLGYIYNSDLKQLPETDTPKQLEAPQ